MKLMLATLILALLPAMASANDFDTGWVAYKKGDYEAVFEAWLSLAKAGDAQSQTAVGSLYYIGLGVRHDHAEARRLYLLAAEQGFASALFNLGIFYSNPDDEQDLVEAYKWFTLAANKGMQEGNWRQVRLAEKMTAAQIAEAETRARAWLDVHPQ